MPPATKSAARVRVCAGAGMTAGLEIWRAADGTFTLHDASADGRFADDVATWGASLKPTTTKKRKNAA
jgi:hypothetical protein